MKSVIKLTVVGAFFAGSGPIRYETAIYGTFPGTGHMLSIE